MKLVLVAILVLSLCVYHLLLGEDGCTRLLNDGYFKADDIYQAKGCMMHRYSGSEAKQCVQQHHQSNGEKSPLAVFLGDSRIRQQFVGLKNLMEERPYVYSAVHHDLFYNVSSEVTSMEFRWRPHQDIVRHIGSWHTTYESGSPAFVILGAALHFLGGAKDEDQRQARYSQYKDTLQKLIKKMSNVTGSQFVWMMQDPDGTENELSRYNELAGQLLKDQDVRIWRSSRHLALKYLDESVTDNRRHLGPSALYWDSQIMVNLFCNNIMRPADATCCRESPLYDVTQTMYILLFIASLSICVTLRQRFIYVPTPAQEEQTKEEQESGLLADDTIIVPEIHYTKTHDLKEMAVHNLLDDHNALTPAQNAHKSAQNGISMNVNTVDNSRPSEPHQWSVWLQFTWNLYKFGLIMVYFYICDRTDVFGAENKVFQPQQFFIALAVLLLLGLLSIRKAAQDDILNRGQTDEWKGWMQLVILVYHYTGASQNLQIYMYIRILVSSYLVMTGYGHVMYALKHRKQPLRQVMERSAEVLFRLNLLTVSLCVVMRRHYQFYYFVPLVSFWYLCIIFITSIPILITGFFKHDGVLNDPSVIAAVSVGVYVANGLLYKYQVVFQSIFSLPVIKWLFVTDTGSLQEWFFRWSTDRYSCLYGVALGLAMIMSRQFHSAVKLSPVWQTCVKLVLLFFTVPGLLIYVAMGDVCSSKPDCNRLHTMACVIPIVSYIILRNLSHTVRSYNSLLFTWVGKISLELFIGQYHIWLAADTKGLLVLIPGYPLCNFTVTSVIFVCIAHEIHSITTAVTRLLFHKQSE